MTGAERQTLRRMIDQRRREQIQFELRQRTDESSARRARLLAACGPCVAPVRRENQVRSVLRMLDQQAKRNSSAPAGDLGGSSTGGREGGQRT